MAFDPKAYGKPVADILALVDNGHRLIPLVARGCASPEAKERLQNVSPGDLFPDAAMPEAAMAGLWLYFSCLDECHAIAQDISTAEGSLWHGILHRQEPDSGNAAYWFRHAGRHRTFDDLLAEASAIVARYPQAEFRPGSKWDPFSFIMFCERARQQPDSFSEKAALEIQRAEWQLLFDYCARPGRWRS